MRFPQKKNYNRAVYISSGTSMPKLRKRAEAAARGAGPHRGAGVTTHEIFRCCKRNCARRAPPLSVAGETQRATFLLELGSRDPIRVCCHSPPVLAFTHARQCACDFLHFELPLESEKRRLPVLSAIGTLGTKLFSTCVHT